MLISDIASSIHFKNVAAGGLPNEENTLHEDIRHGNRLVIPYCQYVWRKPGAQTVIQLESDSNEVPVLKAYYNRYGLGDELEIVGTLAATRGTTDIRYFFNFIVDLSLSFFDKKTVYFLATQGDNQLTSEPIFADDFEEMVLNGRLKYLKYANFDINQNFLDWENLGVDYLEILVPAAFMRFRIRMMLRYWKGHNKTK